MLSFLIGIVFTFVTFTLPIILYRTIKGKPISNKKARKISIIFAVCHYIVHLLLCFFVYMMIIEYVDTDVVAKAPNILAYMLWTGVNIRILSKGYCGEDDEELLKDETQVESLPKLSKPKSHNNSLVTFSNISATVLSIISILGIILAMNFQDSRRNSMEPWNTTVVYFVLLSLFLITFLFSVISWKKHTFKLLPFLSCVLIISSIIIVNDWSVFSDAFFVQTSERNNWYYYTNHDEVAIFNAFWVVGAISIFVVSFLPLFAKLTKQIKTKWYNEDEPKNELGAPDTNIDIDTHNSVEVDLSPEALAQLQVAENKKPSKQRKKKTIKLVPLLITLVILLLIVTIGLTVALINTSSSQHSLDSSQNIDSNELDIEVYSLTTRVVQGDAVKLTIKGTPNTLYSITVKYNSKVADIKNLKPKYSNDKGFVQWAWPTTIKTPPGIHEIIITSNNNNATINFMVEND